MREIKFRAWSREHSLMFCVDEMSRDYLCEDTRKIAFIRSDCVLMQFTGLRDKNDKEIYEGDIVSRNGRLGQIMIGEYEIWFFDGLINLAFYPFHKMGVEVIGNIYENPELLKKE